MSRRLESVREAWAAPPRVAPAPESMTREAPSSETNSRSQTEEEAEAWAEKWYSGYQPPTSVSHNLFVEPEGLFDLLGPQREGELPPVRLLRGSWLLGRASALRRATTDSERAQLALPRRQTLEKQCPEAFMSADEVLLGFEPPRPLPVAPSLG